LFCVQDKHHHPLQSCLKKACNFCNFVQFCLLNFCCVCLTTVETGSGLPTEKNSSSFVGNNVKVEKEDEQGLSDEALETWGVYQMSSTYNQNEIQTSDWKI